MLATSPSGILVAGLAAALLASGCSSSKGGSGASPGPAACGTPTAALCLDQAWLSTDPCGMAQREAMAADERAFCNQVVVDASKAATDEIPPETVVDPSTGATTAAKVVPNDADGVSTIWMPQTAVGLEQQAAANATPTGLSTTDRALRSQWAANGNRVSSCREYVYEKYLDDARFEDAVAPRHDDFSYVYDVAFGPSTATTSIGSRVVAGDLLRMRDGMEMPVQGIAARPRHAIADCSPSYGPPGAEYHVRNVFFAMPLAVFQPIQAQVDTGTAMTLQYSRCYERVDMAPPSTTTAAASWQWHRDRRAALLARGISLAEMDAWYGEVRAFRQALLEYERPAPQCCVTEPSMACCTDHQATRASLEALLRELFLKAYAAGCLGPEASVCDWSPGYFVDGLRGAFGAAKEADYQRCLDLTNDDFVALAHKEFPMPWGSPMQTAMDYTVSAHYVDLYFADQARWRAAYHGALPADVKDPVTGALRPPGSERSAHHEAGNSLFAAYYEYLLAWGTPGLGSHGTPATPCVRTLQARGSFAAGVTAFGVRQEVLDASLGADLLTGVEGHLEVLGRPFWGQDPGQWTIVSSSFDQSRTLFEKSRTFVVAYIPVTVAGGVSGTLHLQREVGVTFQAPLGDGCYGGASLDAVFTPWVRLEAFASAAVGTAVASAGVKCALTLLQLETPYTVGVALALDAGKLKLTPHAKGDFVVRTLDGRISLFVKVDLGLFDVGYSYDVFRWTGLRARVPLFDSSYTLVLDDFVPLLAAAP